VSIHEPGRVFRAGLSLIAVLALSTLLACSSDDTEDGSSGGSESAICDELEAVVEDFDDLRQAALSADISAAQTAVDQMRTDGAQLRDEARAASPNDEAAQSAADLVGAVEGLETTIRQATQGEASLQGVIQQLEIQLTAIASSLASLRSELSCP
jgi:chromosome segregation ATPase